MANLDLAAPSIDILPNPTIFSSLLAGRQAPPQPVAKIV